MQETSYWNTHFLLPVLGGVILILPFSHLIRYERKKSRKKTKIGEERGKKGVGSEKDL